MARVNSAIAKLEKGMAHGFRGEGADFERPELQAARQRVFDACRAVGVPFLDGCTEENLEEKVAAGIRVIPGTSELKAFAETKGLA